MRPKIAIVYNQPAGGRYELLGEERAELGVLDELGAVDGALASIGYPVVRLPLAPPVEDALEQLKALSADVVFNLFEGFDGRPDTEATVACYLSDLGLRYTGSTGQVLDLALDKVRTKSLLEASGVSTPRYQVMRPDTVSGLNLRFPCIVKPCREDASHGVCEDSVVNDSCALLEQVSRVCRLYGGEALVEEFIDGREFNMTIIGDEKPVALPISEIVYTVPPGRPKVLTFAAKWFPDDVYFKGTRAVCPAEISPALREQIETIGKRTYALLGCCGYARIDFRLNDSEELLAIDVNPNPDISPGSGAALQAERAGLTYEQFIEQIVLVALGSR